MAYIMCNNLDVEDIKINNHMDPEVATAEVVQLPDGKIQIVFDPNYAQFLAFVPDGQRVFVSEDKNHTDQRGFITIIESALLAATLASELLVKERAEIRHSVK